MLRTKEQEKFTCIYRKIFKVFGASKSLIDKHATSIGAVRQYGL